MPTLLHGTTRKRAEMIAAGGPDPDFREPGGAKAESSSTYLESGPFVLAPPEKYARDKAALFPDEGGPAILTLMITTASSPSDALRRVLDQPARGIVGLVDDVLMVCWDRGLHLDWRAGRCRVRRVGGQWEDVIDLPLRKSVFRAILARVAALCNEQNPSSFSPYGGRAELSIGQTRPATLKVMFVNTPAEQRLELEPSAAGGVPALEQSGLGEIVGGTHGVTREPPGTLSA
jgi:hypothetical protein